MSRPFLALASIATAVLLAAPSANAQGMGGLGVAAGASVPTGNFGNVVDLGYHAMVVLDFTPSAAPVGLRVDGAFNEFNVSNTSEKARVWSLTGNVVVNTGGALAAPYLIGGGGWYRYTQQRPVPFADTQRDEFGINIGGGIRLPLSGFTTFIEARYTKMLDTDVQYIPVTFGILF